jgi:hypothetical protein
MQKHKHNIQKKKKDGKQYGIEDGLFSLETTTLSPPLPNSTREWWTSNHYPGKD